MLWVRMKNGLLSPLFIVSVYSTITIDDFGVTLGIPRCRVHTEGRARIRLCARVLCRNRLVLIWGTCVSVSTEL